MNFENILLEKKNSIAYVTVNRPKVLNALNMATMEELRRRFMTSRVTRRFASLSSPAWAIKPSLRVRTSASWRSTMQSQARNTRIADRTFST